MSRTFTHKTDESTLTTLCPRCLNAFRNTRGIRVRRADPYQLTKEPCTYCQTSFGYDYYIQPTSPKSTYTKKGRFDDELKTGNTSEGTFTMQTWSRTSAPSRAAPALWWFCKTM
jgi:hypothetical protein